MANHIFTCADMPLHYQQVKVDEDRHPEELEALLYFLEEHLRIMWPSDHVHVFEEPRVSPKGHNVFHECQGRNKNVILGEN